jgi:diguanylate cyclase (GGDEF)-like protein
MTSRVIVPAGRQTALLSGYGVVIALRCPDTDEDGGDRVAERLRLKVVSRADDIQTTVSIGVAASHPGDDTDSLLRAADSALYTAKAEERNCVRVAGESARLEVGVA